MPSRSPTPNIPWDQQRRKALDHLPFKDDWWFLLRMPDAQVPVTNIISLFDSEYLGKALTYTPGHVAQILKTFEPYLVRFSNTFFIFVTDLAFILLQRAQAVIRVAFEPWGAPYQSEYFLAGIARAFRSLRNRLRKRLPDFESALDWPYEIPAHLVSLSLS